MTLCKNKIAEIERVIKNALSNKLKNHNPEPASMPFHTRLLGKDRLALFSFIHSLNTNFGTTIFEPAALVLAKDNFQIVQSQFNVGRQISTQAQNKIQQIINRLSSAETSPNKSEEIEAIRKVCRKGKLTKIRTTKADIMIKNKMGTTYLFDIKTAKPNAGSFKEFKRTLLEWAAVILAENPSAKINTAVAIPYNPYEPQQYNRWTMRGMLDIKRELKVADEFWDLLGGKGAYDCLLDCFERVGIELRPKIDEYFAKFKNQ